MYDYECFPQELPFSEPLFNTMEGKLFQYVVSVHSPNIYESDENRTLNESDGTIINTSEAYESVFIETLRSWLGGMNRSLYSVGPTVPADFQTGELSSQEATKAVQTVDTKSPDQVEIENFLNNALETKGKGSVFFVGTLTGGKWYLLTELNFQISFGSTYWPPDASYVEEIVNVLLEQDIPFVSPQRTL